MCPPPQLTSKKSNEKRSCTTPAPTPSGDFPVIYRNQRCQEGVLVDDDSSRRKLSVLPLEEDVRELAVTNQKSCCKLANTALLL